ncbi:MAG TPA: lipoprotein insertase outer membrane protein LolB [Rhodocyclaceae bacterium]|nr:lipoprotein insertase outer membrane protein LolB [Rhodocyclaceae bacterium]
MRRIIEFASVIFLAACVSAPPPHEVPPRPPRESIAQFALEARASIKQSNRADTLRLTWQHSALDDDIGFASPLGNVMAELQRDSTGARWTTEDGESYEARSPDTLMAKLTDTPVPLDSLALWVVGRVSSVAQNVQRDALGRLTQGNDGGWQVSIQSYESTQANALPSLIEVEHGSLRIRVAIEDWQI